MPSITQLIADVESARAGLLARVRGLTDVQGAYRPAPDAWSIAEIVEHLYLAELSGVSKIWQAARDARQGRGWRDAHPNRGQSIEAIVAATWKPRETAPPIATPHIGGGLSFWVAATSTLTPILSATGAELEGLPLEEVVFPHFLSGPLDAHQRLEFLRFHIERHLNQVTEVMASAGFPAADVTPR